jgi:hypothetical protein
MAHFMIAQLNDGRYGTASILSPATIAEMHQRTFAADPRLGGWAHGFMDRMMNGHRVLLHDGSWEGFESVMLLVPGCQFGLFISANATGGIDAVIHILNLFYDRFMPNPASPDVAVSATTAAGHLAAPRAGFYEPARHNESTVEKVVNLLSPLRLVVDPDGTVHFKNKTWRPAGNGLYEAVDGSDHLVFLAGIGGRRYAATDGPTYQLMNQTESLPFNLVVLLVIAVVALSALVAAVIGLFRRGRPVLVGWRWARRLGNASVLVGLAFLVGLGAVLFGDTSGFLYGYPLGFRLLLVLPVLAIALGLAALALTGLAWRRSGSSVTARVHQIVVLVGLAAFTWFVAQWNLF